MCAAIVASSVAASCSNGSESSNDSTATSEVSSTTSLASAPTSAPVQLDPTATALATTTTTTPPPALSQEVACGPVAYEFADDLYPFADHCLDLGHGDYHYFDERPDRDVVGTALMVHGNPTSSFVYRNVALELLQRGYRVIAVDHYGFGQSAKPSATEFGYRPSDHSQVLGEFVDALQLDDVTLLVQDWGGPIGLGMAVQRPERINSLMIMNTWAWQVTAADAGGQFGSLAAWSQQATDYGPALAADGLVIRGAAGTLADGYDEPVRTELTNAYLGPFFDPATGALRSPTIAEPTTTFARSIFDDSAMFETLGDLQSLADKPVFFFYGGADPLFGALQPNADGTCAAGADNGASQCTNPDGTGIYPYIDRFQSLWNPGKVVGVEVNNEARHFVQERLPTRVAELVEVLNAT
jgi:haloalkane dehalogenase